jgi:tRNA A37 N6-isopentenylltransferase MiaA
VVSLVTAPSNDYPLIVIAGPTASGKTALALHLAEALNGEIVSCDSVAVYKGMEIGTAKPSAAERALVTHHCLDLYWPSEACTAGDYARHARSAIADIRERGRLPTTISARVCVCRPNAKAPHGCIGCCRGSTHAPPH